MAAEEAKSADNSNKLIVITGASSGIGAACVIPFAQAGHPVLMLARNVDKMNKNKAAVVEKVGKACEKTIFVTKCDVTATEKKGETHSIKSAIDACIGDNKSMYASCLINNAGVMLLGSMVDQPDKDMNLMINVNINGVLNGIRAVTDDMKKRKEGTIINISSMAGIKVMNTAGVYCGTKFAVQAITEALRQELCKSNVRVSVICPGAVATNLMDGNNDAIKSYMTEWLKTMELGILESGDIANSAYFVYNQPARCCIRELQVCPTNQESP